MLARLVLLLAGLHAVLAVRVTGSLESNARLNTSNLPIDAYVDLDYGVKTAPFRADGSFDLGEVVAGVHVVRPMVRGWGMTDLLITIPAGDDATHVQAFIPGKQALPTSTASLDFPLKVSATYEQMYYVPPAGMNILQMLKSPMVLMMLFSGVMAFAVPKMTANMNDPEMAKEMAAQRKRMNAATQMDWSGALASRLAGEAPKSNDTGAAPASAGVATDARAPSPASSGAAARTPVRGGGGGGKRGGGKRR